MGESILKLGLMGRYVACLVEITNSFNGGRRWPLHVRCCRKKSSRLLSHLLMSSCLMLRLHQCTVFIGQRSAVRVEIRHHETPKRISFTTLFPQTHRLNQISQILGAGQYYCTTVGAVIMGAGWWQG